MLDAKEMFMWGKLTSDLEHAQRALNAFGQGALLRRGLSLQEYALTNDGYIVPGSLSGPADSTAS